MELSFIDSLTGTRVEETKRFDGECFSFQPKRFINGFGIRPTERLFKSSSVNKISIEGVEQKHFSEVVSIFEDLVRERTKIEDSLGKYLDEAKRTFSKINSNLVQIAAQGESIEAKLAQIESLDEQIGELSNKRDDLDKKIAIGVSVEKEMNERVEAIELAIDRLNADRRKLSNEITDRSNYLSELKDNINLFPTEIAGYVKQGTNNIRLYTLLCFIPLLIIGAVTFRLFSNSERLLNFFLENSRIGIVEFLISRTPYVIVSASILIVCYSILFRLVSEIVNINRRRQDLYKISIIATDVSSASQHEMELTPEERYELRTQTKIEMLKEHLKTHISEDYSYSPSTNHAGRILKMLAKKDQNPAEDDQVEEDAVQGTK